MPYVSSDDLFEQIETSLAPIRTNIAPVKYSWFNDALEKEQPLPEKNMYEYLRECHRNGVSDDVIRLWLLRF